MWWCERCGLETRYRPGEGLHDRCGGQLHPMERRVLRSITIEHVSVTKHGYSGQRFDVASDGKTESELTKDEALWIAACFIMGQCILPYLKTPAEHETWRRRTFGEAGPA